VTDTVSRGGGINTVLDVGTGHIDLIVVIRETTHADTLRTSGKVRTFGIIIVVTEVNIVAFVDIDAWLASVTGLTRASERT